MGEPSFWRVPPGWTKIKLILFYLLGGNVSLTAASGRGVGIKNSPFVRGASKQRFRRMQWGGVENEEFQSRPTRGAQTVSERSVSSKPPISRPLFFCQNAKAGSTMSNALCRHIVVNLRRRYRVRDDSGRLAEMATVNILKPESKYTTRPIEKSLLCLLDRNILLSIRFYSDADPRGSQRL